MFAVIQKQQAASYEFPYSAFPCETYEEAQEFRKDCLTYTDEVLQSVREMGNPNATEEEVRQYVENQKIGIITCDLYEKLYATYFSNPEKRTLIVNALDKLISNFN